MKKNTFVCLLLVTSLNFISCAQLGIGISPYSAWEEVDNAIDIRFHDGYLRDETLDNFKNYAKNIHKNGKCLGRSENVLPFKVCESIGKITKNYKQFDKDLSDILGTRFTGHLKAKDDLADLSNYEKKLAVFYAKYDLLELIEAKEEAAPKTVSKLKNLLSPFNRRLQLEKKMKEQESFVEKNKKLNEECSPFSKRVNDLLKKCHERLEDIINSRDEKEQKRAIEKHNKCEAELRYVSYDPKYKKCPLSRIGR